MKKTGNNTKNIIMHSMSRSDFKVVYYSVDRL